MSKYKTRVYLRAVKTQEYDKVKGKKGYVLDREHYALYLHQGNHGPNDIHSQMYTYGYMIQSEKSLRDLIKQTDAELKEGDQYNYEHLCNESVIEVKGLPFGKFPKK